jgi:hypothetical protein
MNDRNRAHFLDFFLYIGGIIVAIAIIFLLFSENTKREQSTIQNSATDSSTIQIEQKEATKSAR